MHIFLIAVKKQDDLSFFFFSYFAMETQFVSSPEEWLVDVQKWKEVLKECDSERFLDFIESFLTPKQFKRYCNQIPKDQEGVIASVYSIVKHFVDEERKKFELACKEEQLTILLRRSGTFSK